MATPKPLEFYPRGQLSLDAGNRLNQVTDLSVTADNGAKLKHSLARSPSGFSKSVNDLQGSFNAEIPKSGMERDYFTLLESDENAVVQGRVEVPGAGLVLEVVIKSVQLTVSMEDAVKYACTFIGRKTAFVKTSS
jgi:hypothetical protein